MKRDKYYPTDLWFAALYGKLIDYNDAKENKNYVESDRIRRELGSAGMIDIDTQPKWHPVFESVESRSDRLRGV